MSRSVLLATAGVIASQIAAPAYTPRRIVFDGNDYATRTVNINRSAHICSVRATIKTAVTHAGAYGGARATLFSASIGSVETVSLIHWGSALYLICRTSGGTDVINVNIGALALNTVYDLVIAVDANTGGSSQFLANGVAPTDISLTSTQTTRTSTTLGGTTAVQYYGSSIVAGNKASSMEIGNLCIWYGTESGYTHPDLSSSTWRDRFYSGGSVVDPTALFAAMGTPSVWFDGPAADWNGGKINPYVDPGSLWTVTGAVSDAA